MTDTTTETGSSLLVNIKNAILRWSVVSVFILVALWNISVSSTWLSDAIEGDGAWRELFREIRNTNLYIQMRFYQILTLASPTKLSPGKIRLVYIDDQVHWTQFGGVMPTNRKFLAALITKASQNPGGASAIGLDIDLLAPRGRDEGDDDDALMADDLLLLKAIQDAAVNGVPVILASAFYNDGHSHNILLPNIFTDRSLQGDPGRIDCKRALCPAFGYINLPYDRRQIPINEKLATESGSAPQLQDSFALALARVTGDPDSINANLGLKENQLYERTVFGSFLPESRYRPVSALSLLNANAAELKGLAGKILLIGGHWKDLEGHGNLIDSHLSPVGTISGLGLHANYLASLLSGKFTHEPPLWFDILMDIILGLVIYTAFKLAEGKSMALILALTALAPILLAYLFLVTANVYLDFLLPLELYLLHIAFEMFLEHNAKKTHLNSLPGTIPAGETPAKEGNR